jgi:hypothetical protein
MKKGFMLTIALAFGATSLPGAEASPADQTALAADRIAGLIRLLGSESFSVRERASQDLIRLGRTAKPALIGGLTDTDLEIRRRCQLILPLALRRDLDARLTAFLKDPDGAHDHGLPGWNRFRTLLGTGEPARRLFVDINKAEPELVEAVATEPGKAGDKFTYRCQFLQQHAYQPSEHGPTVSVADLANLLFLATDPTFQVPPQSFYMLVNLLTYQLPQKLTPGPQNDLVKRLALHWIQHQAADNLGQTLDLAVKLNLKEGLDIALKEVRNPKANPYSRAMAIMAVGQLGGKKHVAELEPLLGETGQVGSFGLNNTQGTTEVRDVALATIIHLNGHKLKEYGFAAAEAWPDTEITLQNGPVFLGFSDKAKRDAALKKWKEKKPAPPAKKHPA